MAATETIAASNGAKKTAKKKRVTARASGAKKKGARKSKGKKQHGAKSAFMREHADLKPKDVSEAATKAGLQISAGYVSSFRSKEKASGNAGVKRKVGRPKGSGSVASKGSTIEFYRAVKRIGGVARATELIANIEAYENA